MACTARAKVVLHAVEQPANQFGQVALVGTARGHGRAGSVIVRRLLISLAAVLVLATPAHAAGLSAG
jgi:hypothetical protein